MKYELQERFSEIQCPLCIKKFRVRKGKPRTLKQWKVSLMVHLTASLDHHLTLKQAETVIDNYLKSLKSS
ncbi:MAG: hypothetical protein QXD95_07480 [Nitrososphaeria archaeon]